MSEKEDERYDLDEGKSEDDVVINYCTTTRCCSPQRKERFTTWLASFLSFSVKTWNIETSLIQCRGEGGVADSNEMSNKRTSSPSSTFLVTHAKINLWTRS